jgi:hypothetical protein
MPLTPDRRAAFVDALPRLARPARPDERARLLATAIHTVMGVGAGVVILAENATVEATAGSDDGCHRLAALDPGLGVYCARSGDLTESDLPAPSFDAWSRIATDLGWDHVRAIPIQIAAEEIAAEETKETARRTVGALILLSLTGSRVSRFDLDLVSVLATVAAEGTVQQRALDQARHTVRQLTDALESRVVVEQAKGILTERGGLDPELAFGRLRHYARANRQGYTPSPGCRARDSRGRRAHHVEPAPRRGTDEDTEDNRD